MASRPRRDVYVGYPKPGCTEWSTPLDYQVGALKSAARIIILKWGRGTGKTVTLWLKALLIGLLYPGIRVIVLAPSYKTLVDGLFPVIADIDTTFQEVEGWSLIRKWAKSASINRLTLINGSSFTFRSVANIDDLRGGSYGAALLEEPGYIDGSEHSWAAFVALIRGYGPHTILAGGTPSEGNVGVLGILTELALQDKSVKVSTATTMQNPHFPKRQLALMEATLSRDAWEREVLGIGKGLVGLVYPEWDRDVNILKGWTTGRQLNEPGWEVFEVLDWGYAQAHRLTVAVTQPDKRRNPKVVVFRDVPIERQDAQAIGNSIIADFNRLPLRPRAVITDPAGYAENRTLSRMMAPFSISVVFEKNPARRSIENTIEFVRRGLRAADDSASLFITEEVAALPCNQRGGRGWVPSIENYRLQEVGQNSGVYKSKPKDDNKTTHVMDTIRYFYICMHRFGYVWPVTLKPVLVQRHVNRYV